MFICVCSHRDAGVQEIKKNSIEVKNFVDRSQISSHKQKSFY